MPLEQDSGNCPDQQIRLISKIIDIESQLCRLLKIKVDSALHSPRNFSQSAEHAYHLIKKIFNHLLQWHRPRSGSNPTSEGPEAEGKFQFGQSLQNEVDLLGPTSDGQQWDQIEELLQKEEQKNRFLIKKQLEFKEYQNGILDELEQEKETNCRLNESLMRLNEELRQNAVQNLHLQNRLMAAHRDTKTAMSSQSQTLRVNKSPSRAQEELYKVSNSKKSSLSSILAKPSNSKELSSIKKSQKRILKEEALFALYNSHKEKHLQVPVFQTVSSSKTSRGRLKSTELQRAVQDAERMLNFTSHKGRKSHQRKESEDLRKKSEVDRHGSGKAQSRKRTNSRLQN